MTVPPLTILVVDDVPQNLLAMQALLAGDWQQVVTASSGQQALELLLENEVALALLDVQMPEMDGYTLAELMRGAERTRHIPIIFLTAGNREDARTFRGYEAGAVDFLYKPIDPYMLRTKVDVFLDLSRQRQRLQQRIAEHERLKDVHARLLAALSQDLREPLAAVAMNAELLRRHDDPAVAAAAQRIRATTAALGRQVDHLASLAKAPLESISPSPVATDLVALLEARIATSTRQGLWVHAPVLTRDDDVLTVDLDPVLVTDAIDQILLQLALHANESALSVHVDHALRDAAIVRWTLAQPLPPAARAQLLGDTLAAPEEGAPARVAGVGPSLRLAERAAHAHGGTLVGRSNEREGTTLEWMIPIRA